MLPIERRKEIMDILIKQGSVKADELAQRYQVGVPTIRRDLKYLSKEYRVNLMYGGAYVDEPSSYQTAEEFSITQKRQAHLPEKRIIAQKAARLIHAGDTIALNSGSTVELILDYVDDTIPINVVTLSLNVAAKARTLSHATVYMPGGKMRNISGAFIGSFTNDFLRNFNIDKAFMGVLAVSLKKGVTHSSLEECITNQTLAEVSDACYLVADYSKFDKVSMANMFDLDMFDAFITDDKMPDRYKEYARANDITVI